MSEKNKTMNKKLVIAPPQSFTVEQKALALENGWLVIEAENMEHVKVIGESEFVETNTMVMSLLKGLVVADNMTGNSNFIKELYARLSASEKKNIPLPKAEAATKQSIS